MVKSLLRVALKNYSTVINHRSFILCTCIGGKRCRFSLFLGMQAAIKYFRYPQALRSQFAFPVSIQEVNNQAQSQPAAKPLPVIERHSG